VYYIEGPLFIPLRKEYFAKFAAGEKDIEWRPVGSRWNHTTCRVGRPVVLSCGYGKARRLEGEIVAVNEVRDRARLDPDYVTIFGRDRLPALAIQVKL
jgi:hypothetical protein